MVIVSSPSREDNEGAKEMVRERLQEKILLLHTSKGHREKAQLD